jgi:hypothetical protein
VQEYFRAVLKDGQPIVSAVSVEHSGTFNMSETLVNLRGTPEIAQGELMRFLAEAAWYPTALLPSQGVQWKAIDDFSAKGNFEGRRNRTDIAVSLR